MRRVVAGIVLMSSLAVALPAMAVASAQQSHQQVAGIGIRHSFGTHSEGWGTVRPTHLYNGGDPSGDITAITWSSWGGAVAIGQGKNSIFSPKGGYYRHPVRILLRAKDPTECGSSGGFDYKHLYVREPHRPHGKLGKWKIWTSYHRDLCKRFS
jgi:hypothetical protein